MRPCRWRPRPVGAQRRSGGPDPPPAAIEHQSSSDLHTSKWRYAAKGLRPGDGESAKQSELARNKSFMAPSTVDGASMGEPTLKEKAWEPSLEGGVLATWKADPDLYRFAPGRGRAVYVIDTPPPYPSGSWHVGAAMAYSMIDMNPRSQRMLGRAVLFPFRPERDAIHIERAGEKRTAQPLH